MCIFEWSLEGKLQQIIRLINRKGECLEDYLITKSTTFEIVQFLSEVILKLCLANFFLYFSSSQVINCQNPRINASIHKE